MEKQYSTLPLLKRLLPYVKANSKLFYFDMFCALMTTVSELIYPLIIASITDNAATLTMNFIFKVVSLYIGLRAVEIIARFCMQSYGHIMGASIEKMMRQDVFKHLQTLDHEYFTSTKTGKIMASLTTDLFDITEFAHHCPEEYFIGAIKLMISFIILFNIDAFMTILFFLFVPVIFILTRKYRNQMRNAQSDQRSQIGEINSRIEETFLGIHIVKSFANEEIEEEKFDVDNSRFLDIKKGFYYAMARFSAVTKAFDGLMLTLCILVGGYSLIHNRITPGQLVAFVLYFQSLLATLARVVEFSEQFERGMTGLERFARVMDTKPTIKEIPNAPSLKVTAGEIVLDDISFNYPNSDQEVLKKFNLTIHPGQSVAIVGPSGAGKTTISKLIPRFYDLDQGVITIDNQDISKVTLSSLRDQIGIVSQDVYLFSGTVFENIEYGKPGSTKEEIIEAAKLAGAYEFIMDLPKGFDSYVGERGLMLSGGQKQRISIARVFLKNPPILILDEATSALDNKSEQWIQKSLAALSVGRTTLTIAHRLTTIQNADLIVVLTSEGVVEQGSHQQLLEQKGVYYNYYQIIDNQKGILYENISK